MKESHYEIDTDNKVLLWLNVDGGLCYKTIEGDKTTEEIMYGYGTIPQIRIYDLNKRFVPIKGSEEYHKFLEDNINQRKPRSLPCSG